MKGISALVATVFAVSWSVPVKADEPSFVSINVSYQYNATGNTFDVAVYGYVYVPTGYTLQAEGAKSVTWVEPAGADLGLEPMTINWGSGNTHYWSSSFTVDGVEGLWDFLPQIIFNDPNNAEFDLNGEQFANLEKP